MNDDLTLAFVITFFVIVIGGILGFGYFKSIHSEIVKDTVIRSERVNSYKNSKYLIFGQKETYEDVDSLWYWKWNSSDVYGHIQSGKTYTFKVIGWRIPFLSWYRNIVEVK